MDELEFDVFCAHNSHDKIQVEIIAGKLRRRNIKSWIDKEQILGGQSFQTRIQEIIPKVKSAAIFIGESGLGNWQIEEIEFLLDECKQSGKPLIPVLLPGIRELPRDLGFIRQRNWVSFDEGSQQALDKLEASIKGNKQIEPFFDILLCYKEEDALEIREIARQLKTYDITLWRAGLSTSNLQGSLLRELDQQLCRIWSMAVFVGSNGGPWEKEVIEDIILEFREDHPTVIPVILNSAAQAGDLKLPVYLRRLGSVDFRQDDPDPIQRLLLGVTKEEKYQSFPALQEKHSRKIKNNFEYDVFICHSSQDKPFILDKIIPEFQRQGITYWFDAEQIIFGDPIIQKIEDGLQKSKYVMPCLSKSLAQSGWTRAEYGAIINAEFSGNSKRVTIPIKLDNCSDNDIPFLLRDKKRVEYSNQVELAEFMKFLKS